MATNYDAILEEEKKKLEESKQKQIDAVNKTHDSQASTVKTQYDKAVNDTKIGYESDYERNAVQKLINEKAIAEKNANLGLTDSGLNRTQQTAVQLSYANQKGDIDLAKQNALDTLSTNLATTLSNIEQSRIGNIAEIEASYDAQAQSNAVSRYNSTISSGSRGYSGGESDDLTSTFTLSDSEIQYCKELIDNGGTYNDVLYYLAAKGKVPENENDDQILRSILFGENYGIETGGTGAYLNVGTIKNFRTTSGDNFDIIVGDKSYRVENHGVVKDEIILNQLSQKRVNNGEAFIHNGEIYVKYADAYYKIGATNILFWETSGYQDLLAALQN